MNDFLLFLALFAVLQLHNVLGFGLLFLFACSLIAAALALLEERSKSGVLIREDSEKRKAVLI